MISFRRARTAIRRAARAAAVRASVRGELAGPGEDREPDYPMTEAWRLMRRRQERVEYDTLEIDYVLYAQKRKPRGWRPGRMTPARRIARARDQHGPCPCGVCERREAIMASGRELVPGQVPHTAESLAIHDAETNRELALWYRLLWAPEAAAEARAYRPDDRPASLWAELREVLERLGVLRRLAPRRRSAVLAFWLGVCPSHGPPILAACYRRASLRVAGSYRGAPVT